MSGNTRPRLIIHGGAGSLEGNIRKSVDFHKSLSEIIEDTYTFLETSDANSAVIHGIRLLEDNPIFNAGTGSRIQADGVIRMSASIMEGNTNRFAAVINISAVQHPIDVAALLLDQENTVLEGSHATRFAREKGFPKYNVRTPLRLEEFQRRMAGRTGTVGVVALDLNGSIVAGTSTGGIGCEIPGRVSDSPTVAGNYASSVVGVSATGIGEDIVNNAASARVVVRVDDGMPLSEALRLSMVEAKTRSFQYGVIALDRDGNIGVDKSTDEIFYAWHDGEGMKTFYSK